MNKCGVCGKWLPPHESERDYCHKCQRAYIDEDERTPPVCVCDRPEPDCIGQCNVCLRPYKPELMKVRDQWIARLKSNT